MQYADHSATKVTCIPINVQHGNAIREKVLLDRRNYTVYCFWILIIWITITHTHNY